MWKLALSVVVLLGCKKESPPQPTPVPEPKTAVVAVGSNGAQEVDPKLAAEIADTANQVLDAPPAAISDDIKKDAIDPSAVAGTWNIKHSISIMDGKKGEPQEPLMPASWELGKDGSFVLHGGMEMKGTFVLTKDKFVLSAVGVPLEYSVDKLTKDELVITQMIMPTMGTTVYLERAK